MKLPAALLVSMIFVAVHSAAQTTPAPTKQEVLAKMNANAKVFKSLDAAIERRDWDNLTQKVTTADSGKIYIQTTKSSPRIKLDITEPTKNATRALIDNGKYEYYESATNTVRGGKIKGQDVLQLLLIGFGVTAETIEKSYGAERVAQETLNGETVTVIDFKAKEAQPKVTNIRLWLSRKDWYPLKMELTRPDKDTWTFIYKEKKLNTNLKSEVFKLDAPSDAKRY